MALYQGVEYPNTDNTKNFVEIQDPESGQSIYFKKTDRGLEFVNPRSDSEVWKKLDADQFPTDVVTDLSQMPMSDNPQAQADMDEYFRRSTQLAERYQPKVAKATPIVEYRAQHPITPAPTTPATTPTALSQDIIASPIEQQSQQFVEPAPTPAPTITPPMATPGATNLGGSPEVQNFIATNPTQEDAFLINSPEFLALPEDYQNAILSFFNYASSGNTEQLNRLKEGFEVAYKTSDAFFQQQIRLFTDEIERSFVNLEDQLAYGEAQLQKRLGDLQESVEANKDYLSFQQQQQLGQLARQYDLQLKDTRQQMAQSGFTQSTRRAEAEQILEETTGELKESTQRQFAYQTGLLERQLSQTQGDVQMETERLRELAQSGRLDLAAQAEKQLGTAGASGIPQIAQSGYTPTGGIVGEVEKKKYKDILNQLGYYAQPAPTIF